MKAADLGRHCVQMGITGIEGISRDDYKMAMSLGLEISLVSGAHGFKDGPCDPKYVDKVVAGLSGAIELAAEIGAKSEGFTIGPFGDRDPHQTLRLRTERLMRAPALCCCQTERPVRDEFQSVL